MADISDGIEGESLEEMILEIKDTSELMVDLAYSSLLYNNREIAEEVFILQERMEEIGDEIQRSAIQEVLNDRDSYKALQIIKMVHSVQEISYAATKIAGVVRFELPTHPVVQLSLRESEVIITSAVVDENSDLADTTLGAIKLATNTGMRVIAIKRGRKYIYGPDMHSSIKAGDLLFASGPEDGEEYFKDLAEGKEHLTPKDLQ